MSLFVRRQIPIAIVAITSIVVMADYFLKIPQTGPVVKDLQNWGVILSAYALGFGAVNLFIVHTRHISKRASGQWPFSIWLLFILAVFAVVGVFIGPSSAQYMWIYNASYFALSATIYSSTGFYIASGCYRALRARNAQAVILLIVGSLALIRNAPAMAAGFPIFVDIDAWLNSVPTTSAQRGIMIGAALGAIALGVRTMIGRETAFLGRRTEAER